MNKMVGGTGKTPVRAHAVNQDKLVAFARVLEKPVDPPLFHQALDKVEIGFTVLYLEIQRRIAPREALLNRKAVLFEYLVNDVDRRLLLKALEVRGQFSEVQPRPQDQFIKRLITVAPGVARALNDAGDLTGAFTNPGPVSQAVAVQLNLNRHLLTD